MSMLYFFVRLEVGLVDVPVVQNIDHMASIFMPSIGNLMKSHVSL